MDQVKRGNRLLTSNLACSRAKKKLLAAARVSGAVWLTFGRPAGRPFRKQRGRYAEGFSST
jgi:hypothetical protein